MIMQYKCEYSVFELIPYYIVCHFAHLISGFFLVWSSFGKWHKNAQRHLAVTSLAI